MKLLPYALLLCGFNAAQSTQMASILEAMWGTRALLPAKVTKAFGRFGREMTVDNGGTTA